MRLIGAVLLALVASPMTSPQARAQSASLDAARTEIDVLLTAWHKAAATADERLYFDSLAEDAVFMGQTPGNAGRSRSSGRWRNPTSREDRHGFSRPSHATSTSATTGRRPGSMSCSDPSPIGPAEGRECCRERSRVEDPPVQPRSHDPQRGHQGDQADRGQSSRRADSVDGDPPERDLDGRLRSCTSIITKTNFTPVMMAAVTVSQPATSRVAAVPVTRLHRARYGPA